MLGRASYCAVPLHNQRTCHNESKLIFSGGAYRAVLSVLTATTVANSTTSPIPSDSGSVSPTLVASQPGTPSDLSLSAPSQVAEISAPHSPLASATTTGPERGLVDSDDEEEYSHDAYRRVASNSSPHHIHSHSHSSRRKRRRVDGDYLIDIVHTRPSKLLRQSLLDPAADHDIIGMRYNGHTEEQGHSASSSSLANGDASNGTGAVATNGYATKPSVALVRPPWNTLYKDSQLDREQVMRTVLQALRDVGYS